ncbi:MAG: HNH endonuclease domain-containing protein [Bacteroidales bacterium]
MKKILGLDLGTNSIGWALIEQDFEQKKGKIIGLGSRIIPMDQNVIETFGSGQSYSQTKDRTDKRGIRRLYQRDNLRRERLHRILNILGFLPEHYANSIDFEKNKGQFKKNIEIKLNYKPTFDEQKGKHLYHFIFKTSFNEMIKEFEVKGLKIKIPYDWTIYFLRKKALYEKISKEELAWILLNFNQKRGYYQLRGEDEKEDDKQKEFCVLKVKEVVDSGEKIKGNTLYKVVFENGWEYDKPIAKTEDWINKTKEFIVNTSIKKDGEIKRSFKAVNSEEDWIAIKEKTQQDIEKSNKTVGQYIYETLLQNPSQKIRGKLIRTIERKFYRDELKQILVKQCQFHNELNNHDIYKACIEELYPRNVAHKRNIADKDFLYLFLEDIIFYQRPLKSKKNTISSCAYETRSFKKKVLVDLNGKRVEKEIGVTEGLKVIPKSHPLYQEFRLLQFIQNIRIYQREAIINNKTVIDYDITSHLLSNENDWIDLFDFLNTRKNIDQKQFIDYLANQKKISKNEKANYRWNYVEDKAYPANETRAELLNRLKKVEGIIPEEFLTKEIEEHLWHIIYSVKDKKEFEAALNTFAFKYRVDNKSFLETFIKFPPFDNNYGSYSQKAIKKLLPLMRIGKYWVEKDINTEIIKKTEAIRERLNFIGFEQGKIDNSVADDEIQKQVLKSFIHFKDKSMLKGLNTFQACYLVYDRHSEAIDATKWKIPTDIEEYLNEFKQHSLRNPIVEQVITETLRVVKDIWQYYGNGAENYFNEIHIELGREMKNPADKRKQLAERNIENENTNFRIKQVLTELMNDSTVEGEIRPYSLSQQELLKIYEEGVYQNPDVKYTELKQEEIDKIRKNPAPSQNDIKKYKLWLDQGYCSPYTGKMIPLSKLFTTAYQIEHIIPQARYFDDSLNNKVICESEVNQLKDKLTAYEFLKKESGRKLELSQGESVTLFTLAEYEDHCKQYFRKNKSKLQKLLSDDIPEGFIERQMNDSRYISKFVKGLLSNIVKEENEQAVTSKNIIPASGAITSKLKTDWGLNDKWNEIIAPRFKRMNELTKSKDFGEWDNSINAFRIAIPDMIAKGFNKKRIDHRHHALDALVIACTDRRHIQYLNALNNEKESYPLRESLLVKNKQNHYTKNFILPWEHFTMQAKEALEKAVVSFKQNLRVINKTNNKNWKWIEKNGQIKKELVKQTKGDSWAIRKPMHKETVSGLVNVRLTKSVSFLNGLNDWQNLKDKKLKFIIKRLIAEGHDIKSISQYFKTKPYKIGDKGVTNVEVYYFTENTTATRISLSDKFTRKQLESITDSGIRKILENHLKYYIQDGIESFDLAFNPDGVEELNRRITELNNGVQHHPIYKVRVFEEGSKFQIGFTGNNASKYVEAAKGTNLFFSVYWNDEKQKREFETIPLNVVIEHQKQTAHLPKNERTPVPSNPEKGRLLFTLSPNDLVYVPTDEQMENPCLVDFNNLTVEHVRSIYKMVSSSGNQCFFVQNNISSSIQNKVEFSVLNKMEKSVDGIMIKEICWKLKVDRLGNILGCIK